MHATIVFRILQLVVDPAQLASEPSWESTLLPPFSCPPCCPVFVCLLSGTDLLMLVLLFVTFVSVGFFFSSMVAVEFESLSFSCLAAAEFKSLSFSCLTAVEFKFFSFSFGTEVELESLSFSSLAVVVFESFPPGTGIGIGEF